MNPDEPAQDDYDKPVAYDAEGRPLYSHPPETVAPASPPAPTTMSQPAAEQVVHVVRSIDPIKQEVSADMKNRHDQSVSTYPGLNLSENEYIILALKRSPVGLIFPMVIGAFLITVALIVLTNYTTIVTMLNIDVESAHAAVVTIALLLFCLIVGIGMFVSYYVYSKNRFYLTNESVIQEIQLTLFANHEQTISLGNVEDASYFQEGLFQQVLNFGEIRLSTQGDENTYTFPFVSDPKQHIAALNNAVEAFKNGRPVSD